MENEQTNGSTQVFTFTLAEENFALEIHKVHEVLEHLSITMVPRMPEFMLGVINLRGNVVPVIDLRYVLSMGKVEKTQDTAIVIVEVKLNDEVLKVGALVDAVKEVTNLDNNQIVPPPKLGTKIKSDFITGVGKKDDEFIMILDIDNTLNGDEIALVATVGDNAVEESEKSVESEEASNGPDLMNTNQALVESI